tara:strand:- start:212 stop:418 length:207 start_codon:yes stop_codon:yes gene_type:complete
MKKLITTFAALALIVSVSSCKETTETKTDETKEVKADAPEGDTASEDAMSTEVEAPAEETVEVTKEEN